MTVPEVTAQVQHRGSVFTLTVRDSDIGPDFITASLSVDPPRQDGGQLYEATVRAKDAE